MRRLADSLAPYVPSETPERWRTRFAELVEELAERGELDPERLALTPHGRERALRSLGLSDVPARASFKRLLRAYAVPRALGISDPAAKKHLESADGFRTALLTRGGQAPTLRQALDELVWRALGVPPDGPVTLKKLHERVLARELERALPLPRAVRLVAAKAAGARRTEPDALVEALVRRWLAEPAASAPTEPNTPERDHDPLARFAREVLSIARDPATERFAGEKAFIGSVWSRAREKLDGASDLEAFKRRLLDAHRKGYLVLSRADLTQLLDPRDLAESEISVDGAAFHFVRTDLPEVTR